MSKQKVSAKAVLGDIRSGVSDVELMEKYNLTSKGLESLFEKLVEKKILTAADIAGRRSGPSKTLEPEPVGKPLAQSPAEPEIDPVLAEAMVQHVRKGAHKNQLMMEYGLSPSQFQNLMERLVRMGHLSAEDLEEGRQRKTRQCPNCSAVLSEGEPRCPECGQDPNRLPSEEHEDRTETLEEPIGSEETVYDRYCAWEDRGNQGTVKAYIQTATRCLVSPADFFSKLPLDSGYLSPILFGAMSVVVAVLCTSLWYQLFAGGFGIFGLIGLLITLSITFVLAVIFIPIGMFAWSALVHVTLMALQGAHSGFQATFRVAAYSSVTSVFSAVPVIGHIASLWGFYLTAVGLRETHETSTGKAAGAVLVPLSILLVLSIAFGGVFSREGARAKASRDTKRTVAVQQTGEPLPSEVCTALSAFAERVDSAIARGTVNAAQPEIRAAIDELDGHLKEMKNQQRANEVRQIAAQFAMTQMAIMAFQEKFGTSVIPNAGQQVEDARSAFNALCNN